MPDLTGQSIGRYHIVAPLGEGGMAVVYKAFDTRLESDVAIKFIRKENILPNQLERMTARFEREAKRMAKFQHPNIVKVMDYGEYQGSPYLVMPYLPGGTLKDLIKAHGGKPFPYQEATRILAPVARALQYAHEEDTIHRDVKPANILLTKGGQPMLTDFGVAKILDLDEGNTLTGTGVGVGTPKYMAPEQWKNQVLPQTDVYALGVVLYEMVTGRVPYDAETPAGVLEKQLTEPLIRPSRFVADLPQEVEGVIYKSLARKPEERYADMGAFAQVLEKLAMGALTPNPVSQAVKRDETTIDYGDGIPPSSSAKSGQSEKSAVQTSSTASVWEIPVAPAGQPTPAAAQRERKPTPPAYIPQPSPSAKPPQSQKSAVLIPFLLGLIGLGLLAGIVMLLIILKTPAEPPTKTPPVTLSLQGEGTTEIYPTITRTPVPSNTSSVTDMPIATETPLATYTPEMTSTHEGNLRISPKDGMEMVYIPPGEFLMGSTDSDSEAQPNEKPQHKVYLDAYWIDKTEVTNAMFAKYVEATGYKTDAEKQGSGYVYSQSDNWSDTKEANWQHPGGPSSSINGKTDHPVVQVSWNDAKWYCEWGGGRLPSEAEWEKAARGEDGRKYPWGNASPDNSLLNYNMNLKDTAAVGSYPSGASAYGLLDMSGNVWEWVNDWYDENYYKNTSERNPAGPWIGSARVPRGGSWFDGSRFVRAAHRELDKPGVRDDNSGFRCVRLP